MQLLFDEQLSEELRALLEDIFPGSLHIRELGAGGATDATVWRLAQERDCLLVTKDEDCCIGRLACTGTSTSLSRSIDSRILVGF